MLFTVPVFFLKRVQITTGLHNGDDALMNNNVELERKLFICPDYAYENSIKIANACSDI